jgi:chemotaxis protein MotB
MTRRRIYRRRHSDIDDWLMTYADMITLLLCFFAVFLSVSAPKSDKFAKASQEVRHQFGTPKVPSGPIAPQTVPKVFSEEEESEIIRDSLPSIVAHFDDNKGSQGGSGTGNKASVQKEGDRITTIEMSSAPFFASGSATLSDEGKTILGGDIFKLLSSPQNQEYIVTVEGHTDDNPISTLQFPSNWELSTARAAAVVRYFLQAGIPAARLRAAGYADTFPKVANRDAAGKPVAANQAQNRRVIIKLEKVDKEEPAPAKKAAP